MSILALQQAQKRCVRVDASLAIDPEARREGAEPRGPGAHAPPPMWPMRRRPAETGRPLPEVRMGELDARLGSSDAADAIRIASSRAIRHRDREPDERLGAEWRMEP